MNSPQVRTRLNVLTVYEQREELFSDGIRRVYPIFIRPIDKRLFSKTDTQYTDKTKVKVIIRAEKSSKSYQSVVREELDRYNKKYAFNSIDIKPKVEIKDEKDVKLFIKTEIKPKIENLFKTEVKTDFDVKDHKLFDKQLSEMSCESSLKRKSDSNDLSDNKPKISNTIGCELPVTSANIYSNNCQSIEVIDLCSTSSEHSFSSVNNDNDNDCSNSDTESVFESDCEGFEDTDIAQDLPPNPESNNLSDSSVRTSVYDINNEMRRQSFSRFSDDLRQELITRIMSFLSIRDKLRLESVSKEWQQLCHKQQKCLKMRYKSGIRSTFVSNEVIVVKNMKLFNDISIKLIKKFLNLTELELEGNQGVKHNITDIIQEVIFYQKHLERVMFWGVIDREKLFYFSQVRAETLKVLDINSGQFLFTNKQLIQSNLLSNNLQTLSAYHCLSKLAAIPPIPQLSALIDVNIRDTKGLYSLTKTVYTKQLKKINFFSNQFLNNCQQISRSLRFLSQFSSLESMDFYFENNAINNKFKPISRNCQHLKEIHIFCRNGYFTLSRLKHFRQLRVLGLFIECIPGMSLSFKDLSSLELTELWMNCDISLEEFKIFMQMKTLTKLHIKSHYILNEEIRQIITNSVNIRHIYLEDVLINQYTIPTIVLKACKNPGIQYSMISELYEEHNYGTSVFKTIIKPWFPKNVLIIKKCKTG